MAKGFFTQSACVLLSRPATLDEIVPLLTKFQLFKLVNRTDAAVASAEMGGPSVLLSFLPEVNGHVEIDVQDRPWPDHMGDPKAEPMLFAAWSMGYFGPFAFPGGLQRAAEQSLWKPGREIPERHRAFIRIRTSYILGAEPDARVLPANYDPVGELVFVTRVARELLGHPAVLAYFNPNGETLLDQAALEERPDGLPAIDVWTNVRLFNLGNGWSAMDTVGMSQLDRPDLEACFLKGSYDPGEVDNFLRNVSLYLLKAGDVIEDGHTVGGPGDERWRSHHVEKALGSPPRPTLRFFPASIEPPAHLLG